MSPHADLCPLRDALLGGLGLVSTFGSRPQHGTADFRRNSRWPQRGRAWGNAPGPTTGRSPPDNHRSHAYQAIACSPRRLAVQIAAAGLRPEGSPLIATEWTDSLPCIVPKSSLHCAISKATELTYDHPTRRRQLWAASHHDRGRTIAHFYVSLPGVPAPHGRRHQQPVAAGSGQIEPWHSLVGTADLPQKADPPGRRSALPGRAQTGSSGPSAPRLLCLDMCEPVRPSAALK